MTGGRASTHHTDKREKDVQYQTNRQAGSRRRERVGRQRSTALSASILFFPFTYPPLLTISPLPCPRVEGRKKLNLFSPSYNPEFTGQQPIVTDHENCTTSFVATAGIAQAWASHLPPGCACGSGTAPPWCFPFPAGSVEGGWCTGSIQLLLPGPFMRPRHALTAAWTARAKTPCHAFWAWEKRVEWLVKEKEKSPFTLVSLDLTIPR